MTLPLTMTESETLAIPCDQATGLRSLKAQSGIAWFKGQQDVAISESRCRVIVVTSGKGGVGKSTYALNLAVALGEMGQRVLLLDAAEGVSHLDLMCGLHSYWNLEHVGTGARQLSEVILNCPGNVKLLTGCRLLLQPELIPVPLRTFFIEQLAQLERSCDTLIVDAGTASFPLVYPFVRAADRIDLITTPEPTSIANTYAVLKHLSVRCQNSAGILITSCHEDQHAEAIFERLARTSRTFLQYGIEKLGKLGCHEDVMESIGSRTPFVLKTSCPVSAQIRRFAGKWTTRSFAPRKSFFRLVLSETEEKAMNCIHATAIT